MYRRYRDDISALRGHTGFWSYYLSRSISALGSNLAPIALALAVLAAGGTPWQLALVIGARTVPFVAFLMVGGVVADRVSRRRLMAGADALRFVSQAAIAMLLMSDHFMLPALLLLTGLTGVGDAFHRPSANGLLRELVTEDKDRTPANALLSLSNNVASIAGPLTAGVLAAAGLANWGLLIDACTFGISALLMLRLPASAARTKVGPQPSFRTDFKDGWLAVRTRSWLGLTVGSAAVMQAVTYPALWVLGPVVIATGPQSSAVWGVVGAALAAGAIVGDLAAFRIRPRRPLLVECLVAGGFVVLPIALALTRDLRIVLPAAIVAGIALSVSDTVWLSCLQRYIPDELQSRVSSFDWLGSTALRPLGYLAIGWLAGVAAPGTVLLAAGLIMLAVQLAVCCAPAIRRFGTEPTMTDRPTVTAGI